MPTATKKSVCVAQEEFIQPQEYSENEFPVEFNTSQEDLDVTYESRSDPEVVLNPKPSTSKMHRTSTK